ncbi:MAG TPA: IclR family transcriptional regulator C-terminal domain-containing protein [Nocardioides sp.]
MSAAPPEPIQSLVRGLAVIRAFDADHPRLSLADAARRSGLSRATARRVLHTLVAEGYATTDGRVFGLTPRVLELGFSYLSALGLPALAQPHLERLSGEVAESTSLAVLDGPDIVYVARVATRRIMSVQITVGTRFPAYATSMGRVLLAGLDEPALAAYVAGTPLLPRTPRAIADEGALRAELDRVRAQGWALVDQELERGLRSVAAPVRDGAGAVVAAVNVSTSTHDDRRLPDDVLDPLLACTAAIGADLAVGSP